MSMVQDKKDTSQQQEIPEYDSPLKTTDKKWASVYQEQTARFKKESKMVEGETNMSQNKTVLNEMNNYTSSPDGQFKEAKLSDFDEDRQKSIEGYDIPFGGIEIASQQQEIPEYDSPLKTTDKKWASVYQEQTARFKKESKMVEGETNMSQNKKNE